MIQTYIYINASNLWECNHRDAPTGHKKIVMLCVIVIIFTYVHVYTCTYTICICTDKYPPPFLQRGIPPGHMMRPHTHCKYNIISEFTTIYMYSTCACTCIYCL